MADIFISYASEDRDRITPLVDRLEGEGWTVWWDRDLVAGPSYGQKIQESLDEAKCVVVAWSSNSINSNWCRDEANEGLERDALVPFCLDNVRPPLWFRSLQTASLHSWPAVESELDTLMAGITECIAAQAEGTANARSIAVLPFVNQSSNPDQEYFCDGLAEDIITELSHIPQLFLISRTASFSFKGQKTDVGQISRRLGVNYILEGTVRRGGDRLRVSAQLIEAATQKTIWSNRYDRDNNDVFALQDDLTAEIVTALDVELVSGEEGRRRRSGFSSPQAGELLYRGMYEHYKFERPASDLAREHFAKFIELEPESPLGYAWLSNSWSFALVVGWEEPQVALGKIREWADKCLALDPEDAVALYAFSMVSVMVGDLEGAVAAADRATLSSPTSDEAWFIRGYANMFYCDFDESIRSLERSWKLCPILNSVKLGVLATAYRNAGRYEEAINAYQLSLEQSDDFYFAHSGMAVIYSMMGDDTAAAAEVQKALVMEPTYTVERFINPNMYRDPSIMQQCAEALVKAGMPEH